MTRPRELPSSFSAPSSMERSPWAALISNFRMGPYSNFMQVRAMMKAKVIRE